MAGVVANANSKRIQGQQQHAGNAEKDRQGRTCFEMDGHKRNIGAWKNFPTQSPICTGNDGFSAGLDGITFSKWRNESIKAAGNAIVPQVAYQIFSAINEYNKTP
jgi:DNA (cytosine-5)-methyltransferase 1